MASLKLLRLINLNWDFVPRIENASIFNRLLTIGGIDSSGYETDLAVLTGTASVAVIGQYDLYKYQDVWSDLTIEATTIKPQFKVTFVNDDGTVLDTQYIEQFEYDKLIKELYEIQKMMYGLQQTLNKM